MNKFENVYNNVNKIMFKEENQDVVLELIYLISSSIDCNIIFCNVDGKILYKKVLDGNYQFECTIKNEQDYIEYYFNKHLNNITESKFNLLFQDVYIFTEPTKVNIYRINIIPVYPKNRLGTIILYKKTPSFLEEELTLIYYVTSIICITLKFLKDEEEREYNKSKRIVKSVVSKLSYYELDAIIYIFGNIEEDEGIIISSNIAKKSGITPSIIGNGLRKLESSGVIECRSLGMKGTYIKITNLLIKEELKKYTTKKFI